MRGFLSPGSLRPGAGCCSCSCCNGDNGGDFFFLSFGDDPNAPRPDVIGFVYWVGTIQPVNAIDGDIWLDTSGGT